MSADDYRVPVKVWLHASTFRTLNHFAAEHRADVGEVLGQLADRAVKQPAKMPKRKWVRMTPDRLNELVRMAEAGKTTTAIAEALGVSPASVHAHRKRLRLENSR